MQVLTWFLFPVWIDWERLTRKSRGIFGFWFSVKFYKGCFDSRVRKSGLMQALRLYLEM